MNRDNNKMRQELDDIISLYDAISDDDLRIGMNNFLIQNMNKFIRKLDKRYHTCIIRNKKLKDLSSTNQKSDHLIYNTIERFMPLMLLYINNAIIDSNEESNAI